MDKTRHLWQAALVAIMLLAPQYAQARKIGDITNDGKVNISDVTTLISYVLAGECPFDDFNYVDLDQNREIGIGDVTFLIQMLLTNYSGADRITYTVNGVDFTMCRVEGGTFMMGSTIPTTGGQHTTPVHPVTLSTYYIGQTMVTWELWKAVTGDTRDITGKEKFPARGMTISKYEGFCQTLSNMTGAEFHVATEAQWEFAARGGNQSHGYLYAGSDNFDDVAGYYGEEGYDVGQYQPNELGLYDMSGNGYEMVRDYVYSYEASEEPLVDPCFNTVYSSFQMFRSGGSDRATVYFRDYIFSYGLYIGVRIVMVADE